MPGKSSRFGRWMPRRDYPRCDGTKKQKRPGETLGVPFSSLQRKVEVLVTLAGGMPDDRMPGDGMPDGSESDD